MFLRVCLRSQCQRAKRSRLHLSKWRRLLLQLIPLPRSAAGIPAADRHRYDHTVLAESAIEAGESTGSVEVAYIQLGSERTVVTTHPPGHLL